MANPLVPTGILADIKTALNRGLIDSATITRTAAVLPCRVFADTREIHVPGIPQLMRIPRWRVEFADAVDVRPGDIATVAGKGVYALTEVLNPRTYSTSTICHAVLTNPSANTNSVSFANATVTFQRLKSDGSAFDQLTGIGVYIDQAGPEPHMDAYGGLVTWRVYYQNSLTINSIAIQADDQIVWTGTHRGYAVLERPQQLYGPLPYACAVFREGV